MNFAEFYYDYTVQESDIDFNNHMNNVAYFNLINNVAEAHWAHLSTSKIAKKYNWVARRHEIDYLASCFEGDLLRVKTWIGEPTGATWWRYYSIIRVSDNKVIAKAQTNWVLLSLETKRPSRITEEVIEIFLAK